MFRPRVRFRPKKSITINHHQQFSPLLFSPTLYSPPRCALHGTGPCRASSGGTGAPWRWRRRRPRARASRCQRLARARARLAARRIATMKPFFFSRVVVLFNSPEKFQSNEYAKQRRESEINPAAASKNEIRRAEEGGGEEKRRWKARASERARESGRK